MLTDTTVEEVSSMQEAVRKAFVLFQTALHLPIYMQRIYRRTANNAVFWMGAPKLGPGLQALKKLFFFVCVCVYSSCVSNAANVWPGRRR